MHPLCYMLGRLRDFMHLLSVISRPVKDSFLVHKMTLLKNFRRLATDDAQTLTLQSNMEDKKMEPKFISISEESLIFLIFFFVVFYPQTFHLHHYH